MADTQPFWFAGQASTSAEAVEVTNPQDGSVVGRLAVPTAGQVGRAVAGAAGWPPRQPRCRRTPRPPR